MGLPINKVFEFFDFEGDPRLLLSALYGKKAFVGVDHELDWGEFSCCAFFYKLQGMRWPKEKVAGICAIVFPVIKKAVADMKGVRVDPIVTLIADDRYLLIGDNHVYDMDVWKEIDKEEFEKRNQLLEVSICFLISATAVLAAERFVRQEPEYARDCPFVAKPKRPPGPC